MKILQITFGVVNSTSCLRLRKALVAEGHEVKIICLSASDKVKDENGIDTIELSLYFKLYRKLYRIFEKHFGISQIREDVSTYFSIGNDGVPYTSIKRYVKEADVVHIHWALMLINYRNLKNIVKDAKKVVWTAHDCWPFTGGCHHTPNDCRGYEKGCGNCPLLKKSCKSDLSRKIIKKKENVYTDKLIMVGPSVWITNKMKNSSLLRNNQVVTIPNALNCDVFKIKEPYQLKKKYKLPLNKKILMVGAYDMASPYKGYENFLNILNILKNDVIASDIVLITVGHVRNMSDLCGDIACIQMGYVDSEEVMSELYNASDVFMLTSVKENLPTVVMESLSCGTPVTAFDIGGVSDMISHNIDGYIAKPFDAEDFVKGIKWCLDGGKENSQQMHEKMRDYCSYPVIAKKYLDIYES